MSTILTHIRTSPALPCVPYQGVMEHPMECFSFTTHQCQSQTNWKTKSTL